MFAQKVEYILTAGGVDGLHIYVFAMRFQSVPDWLRSRSLISDLP